MHFHLPKPLHGWRALAGEVGIIVVGVLIALGAEQVVENIHWNHQLGLERAALNTEVIGNLDAVQARMVLEPCVRSRLRELAQVLNAQPGTPPRLIGPVGIPLPIGGGKGAWNIALTSGALSHMPVQEQLAYSNAFSNYENWDAMRRDERAAWIHLDVLKQGAVLSPGDWSGLRQAYAEAIAADERIAHVGPFILQSASVGQRPESGITPDELFKEEQYGAELCRPLIALNRESAKPQWQLSTHCGHSRRVSQRCG